MQERKETFHEDGCGPVKSCQVGVSTGDVGAGGSGEPTVHRNDADGMVSVEGGRVKICPPIGRGKKASITPGKNVSIFVNGDEIADTRMLAEDDRVVIRPVEEKATVKCSVERDKRLMSAFLSVAYVQGRIYRVADHLPVNSLVVNAEPAGEIPAPTLEFKTVMRKLAANHVAKKLVDKEKILRLLAVKKDFIREPVARGIEPRLPVDEEIDYVFTKKKHVGTESNRLLNRIISVEPEEVLAVKVPPVAGEPGVDVTGAPVLPREPKRVEIKVGEGAVLVEGGAKAVAKLTGRPDVTNGIISVFPVYVHSGDVSPTSGDIEFKGDVEITGNVEDYMVVRAGGNGTINGYVANATIDCGGNITVKGNVITSKLVAGGLSALYKEISRYLGVVDRHMSSLIKSVGQLQQQFAGGKLPVGSAVKLILERKMPYLPKKCAEFKKSVEGRMEINLIDKDILDLIRDLATAFSVHAAEKRLPDIQSLLVLARRIKKIVAALDGMVGRDASIFCSYAQSSTLVANCDIHIEGKGCFQSMLRAGNRVTVIGIVKGGEIVANGPVKIAVAGSEVGVTTRIKTVAEHFVKLDVVWPGVKVWVGEVQKSYSARENKVLIAGSRYKGG